MKNIIFIHGMFQNPKSWQKWEDYFSSKGYYCIAPAWPLHAGEPAELRANPPEGLGDLQLQDILTEIKSIVAQTENPIVIGHSVGGLIVQLLINQGLASAGVAIDSVAPNAMLDFDWGFFKNSALIANPFKGNEPFSWMRNPSMALSQIHWMRLHQIRRSMNLQHMIVEMF